MIKLASTESFQAHDGPRPDLYPDLVPLTCAPRPHLHGDIRADITAVITQAAHELLAPTSTATPIDTSASTATAALKLPPFVPIYRRAPPPGQYSAGLSRAGLAPTPDDIAPPCVVSAFCLATPQHNAPYRLACLVIPHSYAPRLAFLWPPKPKHAARGPAQDVSQPSLVRTMQDPATARTDRTSVATAPPEHYSAAVEVERYRLWEKLRTANLRRALKLAG
ncbi:hypothetical protein PybrP1_004525 [[Pythium] brassicae (nom. inval.)]|nr:hypothetical protein PybrP1_004525 [[Pythium] brassicae (nom. inval.)]